MGAFRGYRDANITHCDRQPAHLTLGRAPSLGGAPVTQVIDTDIIKQGFDAWRMAHWFGSAVCEVCQLEARHPMEYGHTGYVEGWSANCVDLDHKTAIIFLRKQFTIAEHAADSDGMCRGMRQLVDSVVKPAFQVAMGINQ